MFALSLASSSAGRRTRMRFLGGGGLLDYGNEEHHDHAYDDHEEVK